MFRNSKFRELLLQSLFFVTNITYSVHLEQTEVSTSVRSATAPPLNKMAGCIITAVSCDKDNKFCIVTTKTPLSTESDMSNNCTISNATTACCFSCNSHDICKELETFHTNANTTGLCIQIQVNEEECISITSTSTSNTTTNTPPTSTTTNTPPTSTTTNTPPTSTNIPPMSTTTNTPPISTTTMLYTTPTSHVNPITDQTFPKDPAALPVAAIAATIVVIILILALLVIIVFVSWLVFRYKSKRIEQRYEETPNERYVSKELDSLPMIRSNDPMYDTIDDTTAGKKNHQTASLGSLPPLPPATEFENGNGMSNGMALITPGMDNLVYFQNSHNVTTSEPVLPYEEPVNALNSFHLSTEKKAPSPKTETNTETETLQQQQQQKKINHTEPPTKFSKGEPVIADYAVLERPGNTVTTKANSSQATDRPALSQNTNEELMHGVLDADYAVLEGPSPSHGAHPNPAYDSTRSAIDASATSSSDAKNHQNDFTGVPYTIGPDYATLDPPNTNE